MKKFSKISESQENQKCFEITATVKLEICAENEGEAGYIADSILGSIKDQSNFQIDDISEINKSL